MDYVDAGVIVLKFLENDEVSLLPDECLLVLLWKDKDCRVRMGNGSWWWMDYEWWGRLRWNNHMLWLWVLLIGLIIEDKSLWRCTTGPNILHILLHIYGCSGLYLNLLVWGWKFKLIALNSALSGGRLRGPS